MSNTVRRTAPAVVCLLVIGLVSHVADALEVWTPETGEVTLHDVPRDTAEARRRHAMALIGAGQWGGGAEELHALMAADPDADWVPRARMFLARGYMANDRPSKAFHELDSLLSFNTDSPLAAEARALQFVAARVETLKDMRSGAELFDRLIQTAEAWEDAADAHKAKADALLEAGYYLDAEDEYLAIIDIFPRSIWVPSCWYMIAECEWRQAEWMDFNLENVRNAEKQFRDFAQVYPDDQRVPDARRKADEARVVRAELAWRTARYYIDVRHQPWAAESYLRHLIAQFSDLPEGKMAAVELATLTEEGLVRGAPLPMELPGAGWAEGTQ